MLVKYNTTTIIMSCIVISKKEVKIKDDIKPNSVSCKNVIDINKLILELSCI